MQTARPTIPTNTPSIRPGSQTPTAAVYPTNQPIMMTMAPMPFPSPQTAQYYIPQVTHTHTHTNTLNLVLTLHLKWWLFTSVPAKAKFVDLIFFNIN